VITTELTINELLEPVLTSAADNLFAAAALEDPQEAVGIFCLDGTLLPLVNQARSSSRFVVSNRLFMEAIDDAIAKDLYPLGVYHSHPNRPPDPSPADIAFMEQWPGVISVIVSLHPEQIVAWEYSSDSITKLAEV